MITSQSIGVCAVLFNTAGEVLVGKRKNSYKAGSYGLPGGRVEVNEPLVAAIVREVQEETGLTFTESSFKYCGVIRENQGTYDFIHFVFKVDHVDSEPQLCEPDKCEGWEWKYKEEMRGQLLPGHLAALELLSTGQTLSDCTNL